LQAIQHRGQLALGFGIGGLIQELVQDLGFLDALGQLVEPLDVAADLG
jgi:hypothetical protein